MLVNRLILKNYRNYNDLDIELSPGVNIFIGNNAQGKSNALESIFVLALTKSYMNVKDQNLIKDDNAFSLIEGFCVKDSSKFKLSVTIERDAKKLKIDSKEVKKYSDYINWLKVLIFSPYNINFIKDGPNSRRKSINMVISQYSTHYVNLLQRFNAVLKKRNFYLKNVDFSKDYSRYYFEILNDSYCALAVDIAWIRSSFVKKLNKYLSEIYFEITGCEGLELKYISNLKIDDTREKMLTSLKDDLRNDFSREEKYGITMLGIHRDDFIFFLKGKAMSIYGSQGQIRAAILSLKLAETLIFKENDGEYPVLLLDDIFSELDIDKRNNLIKYILNGVQTIITTTDIDLLDSRLVSNAKIFSVHDGMVVDEGRKDTNNE